VSILRWYRIVCRWRAAAACTARAAPGVEIADAERAEDQDLRGDARRAERGAFFDVGAGQKIRASRLERARHLAGAVPVGVGLDDGDEPGLRPLARDVLRNVPEIRLDGAEIDARDGRPDHLRNARMHECTNARMHECSEWECIRSFEHFCVPAFLHFCIRAFVHYD